MPHKTSKRVRKVRVGDVLFAFYAKDKQLAAFPVVKVNRKSFHNGWFEIADDWPHERIYKNFKLNGGITYTGNKIEDIGKRLFFSRQEAFENPI